MRQLLTAIQGVGCGWSDGRCCVRGYSGENARATSQWLESSDAFSTNSREGLNWHSMRLKWLAEVGVGTSSTLWATPLDRRGHAEDQNGRPINAQTPTFGHPTIHTPVPTLPSWHYAIPPKHVQLALLATR